MATHALPALPYAYGALEPWIDEQTMRIHHDKHHQAYLDNLLKAINGTEWEKTDPHKLLADLNHVPENIRNAVRNHGGGFVNHNLFWEVMAPKAGGAPAGELAAAINGAFGSFDSFKEKFTAAAMGQFGSGWAWLVAGHDGKLGLYSLANQDSPLSKGDKPILGLDVWEHAYYLKYQNRRAEYVGAFWNVVNWPKVAENLAKAKK
ncbi:MAG TPA: superoxide dismutase [Thermoanaerobaculaceae bacterium]|nr:superoxide dismutase [Thermoanaerobaculaceae bacterium]